MISEYETSDEHSPMLWFRGYPVYAAHFIVAVFVASMFVTTLLNLFNVSRLLDGLTFSSNLVLHGQVWRIITYGLVNQPSLWFVVDMAMMIWFGREVERNFGRRTFLIFYACLYLLTPLLFTVLGLFWPMTLVGQTGSFAIFIAFATLYPEAPFFFNLTAKWVAYILVGIYTLIALNNRDVVSLISLWVTTGFAYAFVRHQQQRIEFSLPALFTGNTEPEAEKKAAPAAKSNEPSATSMSEVDALLDKIAQHGIGSLTSKERAKLDAARADLLKRDQKRR